MARSTWLPALLYLLIGGAMMAHAGGALGGYVPGLHGLLMALLLLVDRPASEFLLGRWLPWMVAAFLAAAAIDSALHLMGVLV